MIDRELLVRIFRLQAVLAFLAFIVMVDYNGWQVGFAQTLILLVVFINLACLFFMRGKSEDR
jgi:hypothetical protein